MKNKDEILENYRCIILTTDNGEQNQLHGRLDCLEAMDEWAKEVTFDFLRWVSNKNIIDMNDAEIYNEYLQSKTKQQ